MGMFDDISVPAHLLPILATDQPAFENAKFQTRSLANTMGVYRITPDGFLERNIFRTGAWQREPDAHGYLIFYGSNPTQTRTLPDGRVVEGWTEFEAKFTDGKLLSIRQRSENHEPRLPCVPDAEDEEL